MRTHGYGAQNTCIGVQHTIYRLKKCPESVLVEKKKGFGMLLAWKKKKDCCYLDLTRIKKIEKQKKNSLPYLPSIEGWNVGKGAQGRGLNHQPGAISLRYH